MATLTGAQGVSTGHYHAGIVTNDEDYEKACVKAGRWSGDLTVSIEFFDLGKKRSGKKARIFFEKSLRTFSDNK